MRIADLKPGWDVVTNDGHRLGKVKEVGQHFIEVPGGLFTGTLYVPSSAIGNIETRLSTSMSPRARSKAWDWQQPPRLPDDLQTAPERDADREI